MKFDLSEALKWSCQLFLILLKAKGTIDLSWGWVFLPTWCHLIKCLVFLTLNTVMSFLLALVKHSLTEEEINDILRNKVTIRYKGDGDSDGGK